MSKKPKKSNRKAPTELPIEADYGAANILIQQVGHHMGVAIEELITGRNAVHYGALLLQAIDTLKRRDLQTSVSAAQEEDAQAPRGVSDRWMDREIDRANAAAKYTRDQDPVVPLAQNRFRDDPGDTRLLIDLIDRELGLPFDPQNPQSLQGRLRAIYDVIFRLKNPSGDVATDADSGALSKGDSLVQAIDHNAAQRDHLATELTGARTLISRIAAAMQIGAWDADGTQLLEKVQRWETFKHRLAWRIRDLRNGTSEAPQNLASLVAGELQTHLSRLMAPREFAKWLEGKPPGVVTPAVAELAAEPAPKQEQEMMSSGDIIRLARLIHRNFELSLEDPLGDYLDKVFTALSKSVVASQEFLNLMNLVILPLLARQAAAQGTGTDARSAPHVDP